jgi:hypothetical protein
MLNKTWRSASDQCLEYALKERERERMQAAELAVSEHVKDLTRRFGANLTVQALIAYVGVLLVEGAHRRLIRLCRTYLARKILVSVTRGLTGSRRLN